MRKNFLFTSIFLFFISCASTEEKITLAAYEGDLQTLKNLLTTNVNIQDERGWTALMSASESGKSEIVKYLLENKAFVNLRNENGDTALLRACVTNQLEIVKLLIQANASLHLKNKKGYTPLMKAAERNHIEILNLLIEKGAKLNEVKIQGKDHETALHLAVKENSLEAVSILIQKGANINLQDSNGFTPIMLAIQTENIEIIQKLLAAKPDLNITSYFGDTVFTLLENKPESIKRLFSQTQAIKKN